jgi:hypothetical protein
LKRRGSKISNDPKAGRVERQSELKAKKLPKYVGRQVEEAELRVFSEES